MIGQAPDMRMMRRPLLLSITLALLGLGLAAALPDGRAAAQFLPGTSPTLLPPPPPPPPPPRIEVPVVPKLDAPPQQPTMPRGRNSFSDRVIDCLDQGAAYGLRPNDRAAYSRACANR